MQKLNFQILLLVFISISKQGMINFWDITPVNQDTFECLKHEGYLEQVFMYSIFDNQNNEWKYSIDLKYLNSIKIKPHVILSTAQIDGRMPPEIQAYKVYRQFQTHQVQQFWINIANFQESFKPSCLYLVKLAHFLEIYTKKKIGIQSEPYFWQDLFGDDLACPQLSKYDLYLSFDRFREFGGWKDYKYYETYRPVPVCDYPGMQVFEK